MFTRAEPLWLAEVLQKEKKGREKRIILLQLLDETHYKRTQIITEMTTKQI